MGIRKEKCSNSWVFIFYASRTSCSFLGFEIRPIATHTILPYIPDKPKFCFPCLSVDGEKFSLRGNIIDGDTLKTCLLHHSYRTIVRHFDADKVKSNRDATRLVLLRVEERGLLSFLELSISDHTVFHVGVVPRLEVHHLWPQVSPKLSC